MTEKIPHMETIKATAKLLNIPENFVRQKVLSGEIVAVTAGRKYLVNVDKLIEYLNTNTVETDDSDNTDVCGIKPVSLRL